MINTNATVNEIVKLYFKADPGLVNPGLTVLNNGSRVIGANILAVESSTPGIYIATYTPTVTGRQGILFNNDLVAYVEVVTRSVYSSLKNLEDEALGSWVWDKQLGKLNMLRQDGTPLASFDVVENLTTASRERTS
jgi:hypothetical protein